MAQPSPENNGTSTALTYGLIAGIALCIFNLLLYLGGVKYFLSPVSMVGYLVITTIAVLAGLRQKKMNGGLLSTSEALKVVFMVFALGFLLQTFFNFILLNYIDVPFREALAQASAEKAAEYLKKWGMSESQIDDAIKNATDPKNYSLGNQFLGYSVMCIVSFIISIIIALIIRKKRPPFENSFNQ
jgi:hypothetical protein